MHQIVRLLKAAHSPYSLYYDPKYGYAKTLHHGATVLQMRLLCTCMRFAALSGFALCVAATTLRADNLQFTYLWHLEQPIYWPDRQSAGPDRYERAWQSILHK